MDTDGEEQVTGVKDRERDELTGSGVSTTGLSLPSVKLKFREGEAGATSSARGKKAKSTVLESLGVFSTREVLKLRTDDLIGVSEASLGDGRLAALTAVVKARVCVRSSALRRAMRYSRSRQPDCTPSYR